MTTTEVWGPLDNDRMVTYEHIENKNNNNSTYHKWTVRFLEIDANGIETEIGVKAKTVLEIYQDKVFPNNSKARRINPKQWRNSLQKTIDDFIIGGLSNCNGLNRASLVQLSGNVMYYKITFYFNGFNLCCESTMNPKLSGYNPRYGYCYYEEIVCDKYNQQSNSQSQYRIRLPYESTTMMNGINLYNSFCNHNRQSIISKYITFEEIEYRTSTGDYRQVMQSNGTKQINYWGTNSILIVPPNIYNQINTINYLNKTNFFNNKSEEYPKLEPKTKSQVEKIALFLLGNSQKTTQIQGINNNNELYM